MRPLARALIAAWLCLGLCQASQAGPALVLPDGLALDPPDAIDLTQQVIPAINPNKQVLAAWDGNALRYLITVEKLPPDAPPARAYFDRLVGDLKAAGTVVETGKRGEYQSISGWRGNYLVLNSHPQAQTRVDLTVAHYVTDGKVAFVAYARLVGQLPADQLVDETVDLFQTAHLGVPEIPLAAPAPISAGKP